ncbi:MAG: hypothetical protein ACFB4I_11410 [Cyanophyceae cyanobacterium]
MLEIGTLIQVIYPQYAAGIQGKLLAREQAGRWIVSLDCADEREPLLLSLEESDFIRVNAPQ